MNKLIGLLVVIFIASSSQGFAQTKVYRIGDNGPSGGTIFYVDPANAKMLPAGKTYLEVSPRDQADQIWWWSQHYIKTGATGTAVGTGLTNTNAIVVSQGKPGNYAALLCYSLKLTGFTDWFLPSKNELSLIYINLAKNRLAGFNTQDFCYWSSSEFSQEEAWNQCLTTQPSHYKKNGDGLRARCIRAF